MTHSLVSHRLWVGRIKLADVNRLKRRNPPCAAPLCVVSSFSPWEKRRERAQRKVDFFSWICLLAYSLTQINWPFQKTHEARIIYFARFDLFHKLAMKSISLVIIYDSFYCTGITRPLSQIEDFDTLWPEVYFSLLPVESFYVIFE